MCVFTPKIDVKKISRTFDLHMFVRKNGLFHNQQLDMNPAIFHVSGILGDKKSRRFV